MAVALKVNKYSEHWCCSVDKCGNEKVSAYQKCSAK